MKGPRRCGGRALLANRVCWTVRAPRKERTCPRRAQAPPSSETRRPAPRSSSATGAAAPPSGLQPPCSSPAKPFLGCSEPCRGTQTQSTNPARCCAAGMLRQMSLEWGENVTELRERGSQTVRAVLQADPDRGGSRSSLSEMGKQPQRPALGYPVSCWQS